MIKWSELWPLLKFDHFIRDQANLHLASPATSQRHFDLVIYDDVDDKSLAVLPAET